MSTKVSKFTQTLKVMLTQKEVAEASQKLAYAVQKLAGLEDERKAAASNFKRQIEEVQAQQARLSDIVASESDWKPVDCERVLDWDSKMVSVVRLDTGEMIENRAMYASELQQPLPMDENE